MSEPLKVLIYDIETAPMTARPFRANQQFIPHYQVVHDIFMLTWSAKWWGTGEDIFSARVTKNEVLARDDRRIVQQLGRRFQEADVIVAHYGDGFDWPTVNGQLALHGLEAPGYIRKIDTKKLAAKHFNYSHNNLDYLAEKWGIGKKIKTDWELWERCLDGPDHVAALKEMETYNRHDVHLLDGVFSYMLPYVDRVARLYEATQMNEDICLTCGSTRFEHRGYYRTQSGTYPKLRCLGTLPNGRPCGKYRRGRRSIQERKAAGHPL